MSGYSSNHKEKVKKDIKKKIKKKMKKNKSEQKYLGSGSPVVKYSAGYGKSAAPIAYAAPPPSHDYHLKAKQLIGLMNSNQQITSQTLEWETKIQKSIGEQEELTKKKNEAETKYREQLKAENKAMTELRQAEHDLAMEKMKVQHEASLKEMDMKRERARKELDYQKELNEKTEKMEDELQETKFKQKEETARHEIAMKRIDANLNESGGKTRADRIRKLQAEKFTIDQKIKQAESDRELENMRHNINMKRIEVENVVKRNAQQSEIYKQLEDIAQCKSAAEVEAHYQNLQQDLVRRLAEMEKTGQDAEAAQIKTQWELVRSQYNLAMNAFKQQGTIVRAGLPVVPVVNGSPVARRGEGMEPGDQVHLMTPLESQQSSYDNPLSSEQSMAAIADINTQMKQLSCRTDSWGTPENVEGYVEEIKRTAQYMKGTFNPMEHTLNKVRGMLGEAQEQDSRVRGMLLEAVDGLRLMDKIQLRGKTPESREEVEAEIQSAGPEVLQEITKLVDDILTGMKTAAPERQAQLEKQLADLQNTSELNAKIVQKQNSLAGLQDRHEKLGQQITDLGQQMSNLDGEVKVKQQKLVQLEAEVKKRQADLAKIQDATARKQREADSTEANIALKKQEYENFSSLSQRNEAIKKQIVDKKAEGRKLQSEYYENEKEFNTVQEGVKTWQSKNAKMKQQLEQQRQALSDAEKEQIGYETEIVETNDNHEKVIKDTKELRQELARMQEIFGHARRELEEMQQQRETLTEQMADINAARREVNETIVALQQEVVQGEQILLSRTVQVEGLNQRLRDASSRIEMLEYHGQNLITQIEQEEERRNIAAGSVIQLAAEMGADPEMLTELSQRPPNEVLALGVQALPEFLGHAVELARYVRNQGATLQFNYDPSLPFNDGFDRAGLVDLSQQQQLTYEQRVQEME